MKPEFKNRENECVTTVDGRKFFISRSVAVIPQVYCHTVDDLFILVNKRGPSCPDHIGKWALPCGYLDWDESAEQAAHREIFEECDFNIWDNELSMVWPLTQWDLITDPGSDARQNILVHFSIGFSGDETPKITKIPDNETSEVFWMPVSQALNTLFAFGHQYNIYDCLTNAISKEISNAILAHHYARYAPNQVKKFCATRRSQRRDASLGI